MFYFYVIALFFSEGCFSAEISARILTPTENVDNLVGDFFGAYRSTMPVALLVDATKEAHEAAADFYRDVNRIGLNTITTEFFLVKFNNTGTNKNSRNYFVLKFEFALRNIYVSGFESKIATNFRNATEVV